MGMLIDTAVIYNDEEIIDIIHGKQSGLFRSIKNHSIWETVMEELDAVNIEVNNLDELELAYQSSQAESFTYNIKIFIGKTYKR